MKKYIKIACLTAASALTLTSCGEDFLEKTPSERVSTLQFSDAAKDRPYLLKASVRGIYKAMYDTGTGGTTAHNDLGQKGYDIYSDMLSQDMALSKNTYGWYNGIAQMSATQDYSNNENYKAWRYYYRIINAANILFKASKKEDGTFPTDAESRANIGQGLALRAYSYFMLTNYYCRDFNSQEKVLPIYFEPTVSPNEPKTASEVLDVVIADLELAIEYLDGSLRETKYEINQSIARTMLAYAYGAKGENKKAFDQVQAVINGGKGSVGEILPKDLVAYNSTTRTGNGFNDINSDNWIWGQDITLDDGLDLISWWGQMDYFTFSYAFFGDFKAIDSGLYAKIKDTDVRKNWFVGDNTSEHYLMPFNKFYAPERIPRGQRNITTDYVYMRTEEVYLLAAEFAAKTGNETMAKKYLKDLLTERVADPSYVDGLSGDALLDEILLQTRIEMWGEGKSYLSMKRNKYNVTRGDNHLSSGGETYPYNEPKLTFKVPQKEIESNPYY